MPCRAHISERLLRERPQKFGGSCAYCSELGCDAQFWDPATRSFDVCHKACIARDPRRKGQEARIRDLLAPL